MAGFTDNYLRVEVDGATPDLDNTIVPVVLGKPDAAQELMSGFLS